MKNLEKEREIRSISLWDEVRERVYRKRKRRGSRFWEGGLWYWVDRKPPMVLGAAVLN